MFGTERNYTTENIQAICRQLDIIDKTVELIEDLVNPANIGKNLVNDLISFVSPGSQILSFSTSVHDIIQKLKKRLWQIKRDVESIDSRDAGLLDLNQSSMQLSLIAQLKRYDLIFTLFKLKADIEKIIRAIDRLNEIMKERDKILKDEMIDIKRDNARKGTEEALRELGYLLLIIPLLLLKLLIDLLSSGQFEGAEGDGGIIIIELNYSGTLIIYNDQGRGNAGDGSLVISHTDASMTQIQGNTDGGNGSFVLSDYDIDMTTMSGSALDQFSSRSGWSDAQLQELEAKYKDLGILSDVDLEKYYTDRNALENQGIVDSIDGTINPGTDFMTSLISLYGQMQGLDSTVLNEKAEEIIALFKNGTLLSHLDSFNTIFNSDTPSELVGNLVNTLFGEQGALQETNPVSEMSAMIDDETAAFSSPLTASPEATELVLNSLSAQRAMELISEMATLGAGLTEIPFPEPFELLNDVNATLSSWDTPWAALQPQIEIALLSLILPALFNGSFNVSGAALSDIPMQTAL